MFLEIVVGLNSWHAMNRTHIFRVFVGRNEVCRNSLLVTACAVQVQWCMDACTARCLTTRLLPPSNLQVIFTLFLLYLFFESDLLGGYISSRGTAQ